MDSNQKGIPIQDDEFNIELLPEDFAQYDISFKIIVIGDSGVGKSCLTTQAVRNNFEEFYTATVGFEFLTFNMRINNNVLKLQIWDTCGQEVYKSLISNFYRNSSLALILYAINNKESFQHAETWLNDLKNQANPNVKVFLVGNKSDLEKDRKVTFEQGKEFANQYGMKFFETSAKESTNVQEAFVTMTKEIIKETSEKKINMEQNKNIKVDNMKNAASINTGNCNC